MTMTLFQLLLFTGVADFVLPVYRKYYLIRQMKTWNDAQAYCQTMHTDLAIIKSSEDMMEFQKKARKQSFNSEAWIGLYNDINSWRWSFNNEPLGFQDWSYREPNNYYGHEECGAVNWYGWSDVPCNSLLSVLCFDARKSANAKYIYLSGLQMSWYDAQRYCRQQYTDLAIIRDYTESGYVQNIQYYYKAWIGLFRDSWKWIGKTNMSIIMWAPGKPDNFLEGENCAYVSNGQADDAQCSDTRPFFCYSLITGRKQTIKVKIQSKQNVNDPEVKEAIMEKIKQKVMEQGMAENTTVKWIEQPGGVVFHKEERNNNDAENKTKPSCDL